MSNLPPIPRPLEGDVDKSYQLEIGATVTFVAAAVVVGLRFLARSLYARLGWDDHLMLFAVVQALVATILDFVATHWGLGRHTFFLNPEQRVNQQYYSTLSQVFCIHALTFAKISICLTYARVVQGSQKRWLRWLCYTISISVFCINSIVIIIFYAQCLPAEKSWNPTIQGTCLKPPTLIGFVLLQGSFSALTDFVLCILPIFLFKDLQVGLKSKVILCVLMGLGLITGIFAVIRTVESSAGLHGPPTDISYISIPGLMWASMERNIAIMIGSIPSTRPLVGPVVNLTSRTFTKMTSSKKSTTRSYEMNGSKGSKLSGPQFGIDGLKDSQASSGHYNTKYSHTSSVTRSTVSAERMLPIQDHEVV